MLCKYVYPCQKPATKFVGIAPGHPFEGVIACCEDHFQTVYIQSLLNSGTGVMATEEDYLVAEIMHE
jgi:hypothetical protein